MQLHRDGGSERARRCLRTALLRTASALLVVPTIVAAGPPSPASTPLATPNRPTIVEHHVDLNSASRKELMTLPGVGRTEAERIVANRPYLTKTELVSKNVMTVGPFLSLRHLVVAMPAATAKGKR